MNKLLLFLVLLFATQTFSQSNWKSFKKLSGPKQWWVIWHPFKAKKSHEISKEVTRISDSIIKSNLLDGDASGGQVDAFRHAYWMARLKQEIGESAARKLGKSHEKENYQTYKKQKLEDGIVPDKISSEMDLHNNEEGLKLVSKGGKTPRKGLIYRIVNAIQAGKMKVIKKDERGNFLTCEGKTITPKSLQGKWKNDKCLVSSSILPFE
ncbi:hypothetical protein OD91_1738 [Lutibacter sp. Hel_I_33_5]|uniref:DUF6973 domain-containing protein n=1 Tax=Lutibacter sp. Hel_I_33_5 TaxID=1566289 RepID=UPI0011A04D9B|nr:hypothetical protein [Lutibacter sp. Hel_I_33_5]TVZ56453.1 hypothetical protein OD91_1738 [Lutibacter sp. Hel_I_33_5]